ncbi:DNA-directed RNA polymerase subunit K [Candidatus Woesearchaeota archaeon]|jgi:DNA-directed RNA polymerase subunit K/omega|nr:DNA-directed RNA polymerase subunit K [Candidatus Woesearchaeota archaeon]MBT4387247.1 DNA-directed RNA polymerase subunit K [Candidatus Woesearchaeota archaeon]MBT4596248.1 DNA-directed RNA polymerase subunit K [Candidatus Woesearchaeota archaeon]MBT5741529.1 DNA-directed RNA polymerase subunit K [Candidatus Woesearchaeota archaeon]MBT6505440.1 DNA-directed RNA polymerase subunit K [Candidatus Woesearchaeota archaeon]
MSDTKLTKYEKTKIISARALAISEGAVPKVELTEEDLKRINYSPVKIALLEFEKDVIPIIIEKTWPERKSY